MQRRSLIIGFAVLAAVWFGPLPQAAGHSFAAHMAMHMGVVAIAAGFLAFGVAGSRWDPALRAPRLIAPIPASIFELVVVWAWHTPGLHHFARHSPWGLAVEQSLFLLSGFLMWISAFGGPQPRQRDRSGAGVLGLLLTSMHMTLLGALLALAPRTLFPHHDADHDPLRALEDQHIGGAIMLFVGGVSYLAGGLWLMRDLLRQRKTSEEATS